MEKLPTISKLFKYTKNNQCMPLPNQLNMPWFSLDHIKEVFILSGSEKTGHDFIEKAAGNGC